MAGCCGYTVEHEGERRGFEFPVKTPSRKVFESNIARNAASLYVVQACRKIVPIFTIPYLARVLGPSGWGDVAFTLSMGDLIALFAEFGFILSATRELAQNRDSDEACGLIAGGTLGAQVVLSIVGVLAAWAVSTQVPLLRSHPRLLCAGLVYGVAQGIAPFWLFQGLERMTLAASLEVAGKLSALAAIFLFVHAPSDEWKVLVFQSFAPVVIAVVGIWMAHRLINFRMPTLPMIWRAIRASWPMFLLRGGMAAYSTVNVLILAMFAPASVVGYYASAEKLSKAILGLLLPIRDAFYPRLSHLAAHSPKENERLTRISALIEGGAGLILSVGTFMFAGLIMKTIFGKSFAEAVPLLQIMAAIPLIWSLSDAIGFQSLLPAGKEALLTKVIMAGALVNCSLAFILAPRFQATGMAITVVIAEASVCAIMVFIVARTTKLFRRGNGDQADGGTLTPVLVDVLTRTHE
jgi:PST family polysaccharide transporter